MNHQRRRAAAAAATARILYRPGSLLRNPINDVTIDLIPWFGEQRSECENPNVLGVPSGCSLVATRISQVDYAPLLSEKRGTCRLVDVRCGSGHAKKPAWSGHRDKHSTVMHRRPRAQLIAPRLSWLREIGRDHRYVVFVELCFKHEGRIVVLAFDGMNALDANRERQSRRRLRFWRRAIHIEVGPRYEGPRCGCYWYGHHFFNQLKQGINQFIPLIRAFSASTKKH